MKFLWLAIAVGTIFVSTISNAQMETKPMNEIEQPLTAEKNGRMEIVADPHRYWEAQVPSKVATVLTKKYGEGWTAFAAWVYMNANPKQLTFPAVIKALYDELVL